MLFHGYQNSFREIEKILQLQMTDRYKLGSEHPIWERPLLDQEPEKLSYLAKKFNISEDAERKGSFKLLV